MQARRQPTGWLVGLALITTCGKQLNPAYCAHNPSDPDCQDANLVQLDAAPRCDSDTDCKNSSVCDTVSGGCVQCTATSAAACTSNHQVCTRDDTCVDCITGTDCPASGVCLPDNTCASASTILYASPTGSSIATDCSSPDEPCTLTNAVARATTTTNIIQLAGGTYAEGTIALSIAGLQLVVAAGASVTITGSSSGNPLFDVTAAATITQMKLAASSGDGVDCSNNANLVLDQLVIANSGKDGINANSCALTVTRSQIEESHDAAIVATGSSVVVFRNNFIYDGGNAAFTDGGAVILGDQTQGEVRFNTIAFNQAERLGSGKFEIDYSAGFACGNDVVVNFSDNLIASDTPAEYPVFNACGANPTSANWIGAGSGVHFLDTAADAMDLHLTIDTPDVGSGSAKAIRDNANTNCANVLNDIDNDSRPFGGACDYGADEFTTQSTGM